MADASNYFVHSLLRARDWQHRPQLVDVCGWWRSGGRGVLALVGMGGAGKTAIVERFLRLLPGGLPADPDIPKDTTLREPPSVFVFSFYDAPNPEAFFECLQIWLENKPRVETVLPIDRLFFLMQQKHGLMVLDGLEKVQDDGVRGMLGRLVSPKLREFLDRITAGICEALGVLVTSRFALADLRDARPQFFRLLPINEIELPAGVQLLRQRGVNGTDRQLESIVENCGRHALTVDFAGGYIAEFGKGDPVTSVDFKMNSAKLRKLLEEESDEARHQVLKQGHRFARLAEHYRDAMLAKSSTGGDSAALALLERICLFRLGVDAATLVRIFTGEKTVKISGHALAKLDEAQLQKKLDWLVRMRIVEETAATSKKPSPSSSPKKKGRALSSRYTIHPAVRDGFLSGIAGSVLKENHEAVRQGLEVSLGDAPGRDYTDLATLDLLEEIIYHAVECGRVKEGYSLFDLMDPVRNLVFKRSDKDRLARISSLFLGKCPPPPDRVLKSSRSTTAAKKYLERHSAALAELSVDDVAEVLNRYQMNSDVQEKITCMEWAVLLLPKWPKPLSALAVKLESAGRLQASRKTFLRAMQIKTDDDFDNEIKIYVHRHYGAVLEDLGDVAWALISLQTAISAREAVPWVSNHHITRAELPYVRLLRSLNRRKHAVAILEKLEAGEHCIGCAIALIGARAYGALQDNDFDTADQLASELVEIALENGTEKPNLLLAKILRLRHESNRPNSSPSADPSLARALEYIDAGIRYDRSQGYAIDHVKELIERAHIQLNVGRPDRALDDLRVALDDGFAADKVTGQPQLLAAMDPECGYAWGIAEGLQVRGEALLLQAAQAHGEATFAPARRDKLPAAVRDLITKAKGFLKDALARWQPLHDPEPEQPDQNFILKGKPYNYRAAETNRIITDLAGGVLTNYPLKPISPEPPTEAGVRSLSTQLESPRVLISYSHDSDQHARLVLDLANKLRSDGVECIIDQYTPHPSQGWPLWMDAEIDKARFVLVLFTNGYVERCQEPRRAGVRFESVLILQDLYEAGMINDKFIPIVLEPGEVQYIHKWLKPYSHYIVGNAAGYENLRRRLLDDPVVEMPPVAPPQKRGPAKPK